MESRRRSLWKRRRRKLDRERRIWRRILLGAATVTDKSKRD